MGCMVKDKKVGLGGHVMVVRVMEKNKLLRGFAVSQKSTSLLNECKDEDIVDSM